MTDEDRNSSEQGGGREPAAPEAAAGTRDGEAPAAGIAGPAPEAAGEPTRPGGGPSKRWRLTTSSALLLAILAAALAGLSWWQYRQLSGSVRAADARTRDALQQLEGRVGGLADKLNAFQQQTQQTQQHLQQSGQRIDELKRRLEPIPGRVAQLQQQLDALQGGSGDVRATWLRAEARYYLRLANSQLQLAHDWHGAVLALNLADGRLRELADPGLAPVRRLIAQEIDALQAVQLPDIDGLAARLDALASRVGKLPLRAATPASFNAQTSPVEKTEPGLARLWAAVKRALTGLVRVRRREQPVRRALTGEQRALIRRQLAVRLQLAELAAVRRQPAAFRASIETARRLLAEDFDSNDAAVAAAEQTLMQMSRMDIAPAPPDISQSLARLRAAGSGI